MSAAGSESLPQVMQVAAKAVLINDEGRLLILREAKTYPDDPHFGRFHLPGGRIRAGETYEEALRREVAEETGVSDMLVGQPIFVGDWRPVFKGVPTQIFGIFSLCRTPGSEVRLSSEHDAFQWIDPREHANYDLMDPEHEVVEAYLRLAQAEA